MSPLSQSLAALGQQHKLAGSLASLVRAEMPAIETARQAGLSYAQICQGLAALGVAASARTLRHTVYRIQAEQQRKAHAAGPLPERLAAATTKLAPEVVPVSQPVIVPVVVPVVAPAPEAQRRAVEPIPLQPVAAPAGANPPGPSPGFVRNIINTPIDMDEIARQYRSGAAARRTAAPSAQAPPRAPPTQTTLPLQPP